MMTAQYMMSHKNTTASMPCEAAASFCAVKLDSAILAESIFIAAIFLLPLIIPF